MCTQLNTSLTFGVVFYRVLLGMEGQWWLSCRWRVHTQYQLEQSSPSSHKTMPEEKKEDIISDVCTGVLALWIMWLLHKHAWLYHVPQIQPPNQSGLLVESHPGVHIVLFPDPQQDSIPILHNILRVLGTRLGCIYKVDVRERGSHSNNKPDFIIKLLHSKHCSAELLLRAELILAI